jgi:intein/homing endonuclease
MSEIRKFNELKVGDIVNVVNIEFSPLEIDYFTELVKVGDKEFFLDSFRNRGLITPVAVQSLDFEVEDKITIEFAEKFPPIVVSTDEIVYLEVLDKSKVKIRYVVPGEDDVFEAILALYMAVIDKKIKRGMQ